MGGWYGDGWRQAMLSQTLWGDAVYIRDLFSLCNYSQPQLLRAALTLHELYQAYDIVAHMLQTYDQRGRQDAGPAAAAVASGGIHSGGAGTLAEHRRVEHAIAAEAASAAETTIAEGRSFRDTTVAACTPHQPTGVGVATTTNNASGVGESGPPAVRPETDREGTAQIYPEYMARLVQCSGGGACAEAVEGGVEHSGASVR